MNQSVMPYIGLIVAVLIVLWGGFVLGSRYFRRQQHNPKKMDEWVHLTSTVKDDMSDPLLTPVDDELDSSQPGRQSKAQQNGHYSKSNKGS